MFLNYAVDRKTIQDVEKFRLSLRNLFPFEYQLVRMDRNRTAAPVFHQKMQTYDITPSVVDNHFKNPNFDNSSYNTSGVPIKF